MAKITASLDELVNLSNYFDLPDKIKNIRVVDNEISIQIQILETWGPLPNIEPNIRASINQFDVEYNHLIINLSSSMAYNIVANFFLAGEFGNGFEYRNNRLQINLNQIEVIKKLGIQFTNIYQDGQEIIFEGKILPKIKLV